MLRGLDNKLIKIHHNEVEHLSIVPFEDYFIKIYHTLCQVLGGNANETMLIPLMYMDILIQDMIVNSEYDYATYFAKICIDN